MIQKKTSLPVSHPVFVQGIYLHQAGLFRHLPSPRSEDRFVSVVGSFMALQFLFLAAFLMVEVSLFCLVFGL